MSPPEKAIRSPISVDGLPYLLFLFLLFEKVCSTLAEEITPQARATITLLRSQQSESESEWLELVILLNLIINIE